MPRPVALQLRPGRPARGIGLVEGMVALLVLSVGLLGLVRFQLSLVSHTTEAQGRMQASQLADELLSTVLVDTANAGCYVLPDPVACASPAASARAADWRARALAGLPGDKAASSALDPASQRFTVNLAWTGKGSRDPHRLEMSTDVR